MSDNKYNGWTNYETWCVNLWIDNSGNDYDEQAATLIQDAIDDDESDVRASATYALSKIIEQEHDDAMPETTGVFADLLGASLRAVNWYEIAEHFTGEVTIYSAGWNMPGYMPDNSPAMFIDARDALEYVKDAMLQDANTANDDDTLINSWKADPKGEFGQTFGAYHYFVSIV